jgi:6-phosphogluconolactonase
MATTSPQLIIVGTYSEKLGHVEGKGKGLYVVRFNREALSLVPDEAQFGKAQHGAALKNPTYIAAHRDAVSGALHAYVCDEGQLSVGSLSAYLVNESTGELTQLGAAVPADARGQPDACCHVSVSPGAQHVIAANYLCGS